MDYVDLLRQEARNAAGLKLSETIEAAGKKLAADRFKRLRQKKTFPKTKDEQEYLSLLNEYTYLRIKIHRYMSTPFESRAWNYVTVSKTEMDIQACKIRQKMDYIEFTSRPAAFNILEYLGNGEIACQSN